LANDAWFSANFPINGKLYPITARVNAKKTGDSLEFSMETQFRSKDTTFSMHTTGLYNTANESPIWQNTIRTGLYYVEWSFRDYTENPAAVYWRGKQSNGTTTFENDAIPEEFLQFLASKVDSVNKSSFIKILSPVWELSYVPDAWTATALYTGQKIRIHGVDCYQVLYTRSDGARAEYYITIKGKQLWRFQTFRGVWFDRIQ